MLMPNNEPGAGVNCCVSSAFLKDNAFLRNPHDIMNLNWIYETLLKRYLCLQRGFHNTLLVILHFYGCNSYCLVCQVG